MISTLIIASLLAPETITLKVGDLDREAVVIRPANSRGRTPLVFVWHGLGGNMNQSQKSMPMAELWPEATFVYPQGRPIAGDRKGWQVTPDRGGDPDLKFFDALIEKFKSTTEPSKVYSMGHSNGGFFSYLLAHERPGRLAAIAPIAGSDANRSQPFPKISVFSVTGEADRIVRPEGQKASFDAVKKAHGLTGPGTKNGEMTVWKGESNLEAVQFIHAGAHEVPKSALKPIIEFFQRHSKAR